MADWNERWFQLAKTFSSWSKDPSTKVGAVFVKDTRLLSYGWNGFPRGIADDSRLDDRETKYSLTVHAEMNAIYNAGYLGVPLQGSSLYVYGLPVCSDCAKGVIQAGTVHVFWMHPRGIADRWKESSEKTLQMLTEAKIQVSAFETTYI